MNLMECKPFCLYCICCYRGGSGSSVMFIYCPISVPRPTRQRTDSEKNENLEPLTQVCIYHPG